MDKNICSYGKKSYLRRPDHGYFGYASCTFHLEKGKMPENTNYYLNQCGISYKDNNKIYYSEYFILAQILERETPPQDIQSYVLGEQQAVLFRPKYNVVFGKIEGFYKNIDEIVVRDDPNKFFLDYGFSKNDSKLLSPVQKRREKYPTFLRERFSIILRTVMNLLRDRPTRPMFTFFACNY